MGRNSIKIISDSSDIDSSIRFLGNSVSKVFLLDLETGNSRRRPELNPLVGFIKTMAVLNPDTKKTVVYHINESLKEGELLKALKGFLKSNKFTGHNLKYDAKWVAYRSKVHTGEFVFIDIIHDTFFLSRLLDSRLKADLKMRACYELGIKSWGVDLFRATDEEVIAYNAHDVIQCNRLLEKQLDDFNSGSFLKGIDDIDKEEIIEKNRVLYDLELKAANVLYKLELFGAIPIDLEYASRTISKIGFQLNLLGYIINTKLDGSFYPFNFNSTPQIRRLLFHPDYCDFDIEYHFLEKTDTQKEHPLWFEEKIISALDGDKRFKKKKDSMKRWVASFYTVKSGFESLSDLVEKHNLKELTEEVVVKKARRRKRYLKERYRGITDKELKEKIKSFKHQLKLRSLLPHIQRGKKLSQNFNMLSKIQPDPDGFLHFNLSSKQQTGRISTSGSKPSIGALSKNPPILESHEGKGEYAFIRSLVKARDNSKLVFMDFKNMEVRILLTEIKKHIEKQIILCTNATKKEYYNEGLSKLARFMKNIMGGLCPVSLLIKEYYDLDIDIEQLGLEDNIIKTYYKEIRSEFKALFFALFYGSSLKSIGEKLVELNSLIKEVDSLKENGKFAQYLKKPVTTQKKASKRFTEILNKTIPYMSEYLESSENFALNNFASISPCGRVRKFTEPTLRLNCAPVRLKAVKEYVDLETVQKNTGVFYYITVTKSYYEKHIKGKRDVSVKKKRKVSETCVKSSKSLLLFFQRKILAYFNILKLHEKYLRSFSNDPEIEAFLYKAHGKALNRIKRIAVNHPIQSFGSTVLKHLLIRICEKYPPEDHAKTGVRLLMPRHDEVVFEVHESKVEELKESMKKVQDDLNLIDLREYGYYENFKLELDYEEAKRWSDKD